MQVHELPCVSDVQAGTSEVRADCRPVRVCHVSLTLCTGGLERLLVDLARVLPPERVEQTFVAMGEVGLPARDIEALGRDVVALQSTGRLKAVLELAGILREGRFDVVHTHNAYPHLYATVAARLAGVPVVVHTRHGRRFGHNRRERLQFALASRLADRVIAVSDDTARLCRSMGKLDEQKVIRIWNGVDVKRFAFRGASTEPIAIAVGRLSAEKDFATLLRAADRVRTVVPEFQLRLVGDGPERGSLEALAAELCLGGCVQFLGERSDVSACLAEAGFYVCSSKTEGISLTILEAMATGLPVVATRVGGNPEIVLDDETGLLVPPADAEALAGGILRMCAAGRERVRWSEMGRLRVEQEFDMRVMADRYADLYARLLESRGHLPTFGG